MLGICKNYEIMATVYKVEVVSQWINYTEEQLISLLGDRKFKTFREMLDFLKGI